MSDADRLIIWDAEYIKNASLKLDLKIIFLTLIGKGTVDRVKDLDPKL